MKLFDIFLTSVVSCISSLPLILLLLVLQQGPALAPNPPLDQAQISEIQQLLIDHDPRQLLASEFQEVRLTETELNALTTYIKNSNAILASVNIRTALVDNGADVAMSIPVNVFGVVRWFNITLHLLQDDDTLRIDSVDTGSLTLPSPLLAPLGQALAARLAVDENYQLVAAFFQSLHFQSITEERVVILLDWQEDNLQQLESQARQVFVSAREADRLLVIHDRLAGHLSELPQGINTVRLNDLLRPLFLNASINSAGGADAVAENRAIFIVLTAYMTDLDLDQLIGTEVAITEPRKVRVVIESREDLARHVVSSAAIAASAGATMVQVLTVYKEVSDSRFGTGFSFTDIAANQAGTMLGILASRSEADARRFQEVILDTLTDADYLPPLGTYDGMTEEEFIEQYGSRESDAYLQRLEAITDSIAARPFFRAFGSEGQSRAE